MSSDSDQTVPIHPSSRDSEPPPSLMPPADSMRAPPHVSIPDLPPVSLAPMPREAMSIPPGASLPPLPEVQPILEHASELRAKKDWDGALEAYKKALFVVPQEATITQASIYASVAEVKLSQGKPREAETNFEKAFVIN